MEMNEEVVDMAEAVTGYYDGNRVILKDKVLWNTGQEVLVAVIPRSLKKTKQSKIDFSEFRSGGRYAIDKDAQDYVNELREEVR